ncbi:DUF429 domain-containing protein [Halolamina salina]|uniref:DUF429 domain-containing protein n=1 Tax=Halolamina salina TaxID=1220023 RepID=A0ABD6B7U8_9EURY
MDGPDTVFGVDFSGAKEAGKKIWIAEIDCTGDEPELIGCNPATECFGTKKRDPTLRELTKYLAGLTPNAVTGLDFPFALPQQIVGVDDWETFLLEFPGAFASPSEFRRRCQARGSRLDEGKVEYKRRIEEEHDGLAAYNYMLYKQTFYGIRDVLRPLVLSDSVRVPPMQEPDDDRERPTVLETYPAGVLNDLDTDESTRENYKKDTDESRKKREKNLDALETKIELTIDDDLRNRLLNDSEGDALDAVIAAGGVLRAAENDFAYDDDYDEQEGYIYV